MNLLEKVRDLWRANAALTSLLPIDKVQTGRAPKGTVLPLPHARLWEGANTPRSRTSHSHYNSLSFTLQIWASSYTTGRRIREKVIPYFINRSITLEDGSVLDLSLDNSDVIEETDSSDMGEKVVQFIITFTAHLQTTRSSGV